MYVNNAKNVQRVGFFLRGGGGGENLLILLTKTVRDTLNNVSFFPIYFIFFLDFRTGFDEISSKD